MFNCLKRHRLFNCGQGYKSTGLIDEIAESAAKSLSGRTKSLHNLHDDADDLIYNLEYSYPKIIIEDYLTEATKQALLYCFDRKIVSTLKCPTYFYEYLTHVISSWFDLPFQFSNLVDQSSLIRIEM